MPFSSVCAFSGGTQDLGTEFVFSEWKNFPACCKRGGGWQHAASRVFQCCSLQGEGGVNDRLFPVMLCFYSSFRNSNAARSPARLLELDVSSVVSVSVLCFSGQGLVQS